MKICSHYLQAPRYLERIVTCAGARHGIPSIVIRGRIKLVILDMVMPVMNGRDCFYLLKEIDQDVRVILSSGFTQDSDLAKMKTDGLCGFIHKPYRSGSLSQAVHQVLSSNIKKRQQEQ